MAKRGCSANRLQTSQAGAGCPARGNGAVAQACLSVHWLLPIPGGRPPYGALLGARTFRYALSPFGVGPGPIHIVVAAPPSSPDVADRYLQELGTRDLTPGMQVGPDPDTRLAAPRWDCPNLGRSPSRHRAVREPWIRHRPSVCLSEGLAIGVGIVAWHR